jgi:signal transduction histidine kinase
LAPPANKILLVEDDPLGVSLISALLVLGKTRARFELASVNCLADALSHLSRNPVDAVLLDLCLPDASGLDALSGIHSHSPEKPIVVLTGRDDDDVAIEALRQGAQDYLIKGSIGGPLLERSLIYAIERRRIEAERKQMQEHLAISDRMSSIGTLAAGVAHEINNPLAAVIANLEYLGAQIEKDGLDELREPLDDALSSADRVRRIVWDLKLFTRPAEGQRSRIDVRRVIEPALEMAWNEIRYRARVAEDYGETALLDVDESRLGQVVLNLLVNAAQAIPEGHVDRNEIRVSTAMEGDRVVIEVRDTGAGIPPEALDRIFDPFFTTKPIGVGTGLGLSICQRIVTELGGSIGVQSEVGRGTVFRVVLPAAGPEAPVRPPLPAVAHRRRGRVLVVDDEAVVAAAIRRTLAAEHEVVITAGAEQALKRLGVGERFDVILCDLMMPRMTGMDLHAEALRVAPDQAARMVFLTAGAFTERAQEFLDHTPNQRLEKPFDAGNLRALVNDRVR